MQMTVILVLAIMAFVSACVAAWGKIPLYVAVILLCIIELIRNLPLGK
jgi:hypothetical protein